MSDDGLKEVAPPYGTSEFRSPYQPLIDELYREEVIAARCMSPEAKFLAGEELFEYACSITLAGIQNQNPAFTPEECRRELERRLEWRENRERMERRGPHT